jgi:hypothetical protein
MTVNGFEIPESIISKTVSAIRSKNSAFSSVGLKFELIENKVPVYVGSNYIAQPAASMIIQRLKNQGLIKRVYGGGGNTVWEWVDIIKKRQKKERKGEYTSEQLITLYHNAKKNALVQRRKERTQWVTVRSSFWDQVARDYLKQIQDRVRNHKSEILKYAKKTYGERLWMQGDVVMIDYIRQCKNMFVDRKLLIEAGHTVLFNKIKKKK